MRHTHLNSLKINVEIASHPVLTPYHSAYYLDKLILVAMQWMLCAFEYTPTLFEFSFGECVKVWC